MISDLEILCAVRANKKVAPRRRLAEILDIEDNGEFASTLARLKSEDLLQRSELAAYDRVTYFYGLTAKGKRVLDAGPEGAAHVARIEHRIDELARAEREKGRSSAPMPASPNTTQSKQEAPMTKKVADPRNLIEQIVNKSGSWESLKVIAKAAGLPDSAVRKTLKDLVGERRIQDHGKTTGKRFGRLGLASPASIPSKKLGPKGNAKKAKTTPARRAAAKRGNKAPSRNGAAARTVEATPGADLAEAIRSIPMASFTKKGEIVVTAPGAVTVLSVDESREVVELVRAFDKSGLLPQAA